MKLSFLMIVLISVGLSLDCLDENGKSVDYWFILKLPRDRVAGLSGLEYLYCDSDDDCEDLSRMVDKLDDDSSPLSKTVSQLKFYDSDTENVNNELSIIWSDQPYPGQSSSNKAHSKGMMTVSSVSKDGFIINHSLPNYPVLYEYPVKTNKKIKMSWPFSGHHYAQHFFCASLEIDEMEKLAQQYKIAQIIIHLSQFPTKGFIKEDKTQLYPHLLSLASKERASERSGSATIETKDGLLIKVFSTSEGIEKHQIAAEKVAEKAPEKRKAPDSPTEDSTDVDTGESGAKSRRISSESKILSKNKKHVKKNKHTHKNLSSFLSMYDMNELSMQISNDESETEGEGQDEPMEITPVIPPETPHVISPPVITPTVITPKETSVKNGFFSDIVAQGLEQNIVMSTWGKGTPRLQDPVCEPKFKSLSTFNRIHDISLDESEQLYEFKYTKEHSKIGITFPNEVIIDGSEAVVIDKFEKWIIVADLNRQVLQTSRGGTALCFQNKHLWKTLYESFEKRQKCP